MSDPTSATHASGPRAGQPVVAGRCPACGGASLFLGNGHVTCALLECPDPVAVDDLLHGGLPEHRTRREWAAAASYIAGRVDMEMGTVRGWEVYAAVRTWAGQLTPWADQPEPAVGEPEVGQVTLEDLPEDVAERAVSLAMVGDRDGMMRALREGVDRARVDQPEPATAPAQPSGAAPAATGPHLDTPGRPADADDAEQPCADPYCDCCYPYGVNPALTPDPQAGLDREADAPSEPAAGLAPGILGRALLDASGDLWRERPPLSPIAPPRWSHGTRLAPSREWLDSRYGLVTEVLLVSPAAGRALDALLAWRRVDGPLALADETAAAVAELRAAVDALDGDQLAEPGTIGQRPAAAEADFGETLPDQQPAEPAPALRCWLAAIENALRNGSYMTNANLAFELLCDWLRVDRRVLTFDPMWSQRHQPAPRPAPEPDSGPGRIGGCAMISVEIPLGHGFVALVDEADAAQVLDGPSWYAVEDFYTHYAKRKVYVPGRRVGQFMHKLLTGWPQTDHINGNGLDNRRCNLRPVTSQQNRANQRKTRGTSRYKGVYLRRRERNWEAAIKVNRRRIYLGTFSSEVDAACAYDAAARQHFGEFAALNFPRVGERLALPGRDGAEVAR